MSSWEMSGAAAQVRGIDTNLERLLGEIVGPGIWSGPDADRFAQDWHDQVHTLLIAAAGHMDSVSFETVE
ncbi:hypothetical protein OH146_03905 [Salinibacterium sp. SYSU T00001]|uniref:hypothetical protein n=1 Tax=Homoserinimonas sedimenticola TaxID=2986805 RepID=UPI002235446A|nr:hypothetical protein [Salinibacterium sedimenticola]MCW4384915.1 hypothetical protein [Salinibacterium sedimenticola]